MDPSALTTIRYEAADGVATITLDRAESHNAFTTAMCDEMAATWAHVRDDDSVRAVVVTGRRREGLLHRHRPQRGARRRRGRPTRSTPSPTATPARASGPAATSAGSR